MNLLRKGYIVLLILAIVLVSCTPQSSGTSQSSSEIPIGALPPITGAGAQDGPQMAKTIELAVEEVNAAGGPLGRQLKLYMQDSQTDADSAVRAAQKLIDVNKVVAIIGTWDSTSTLAISPLTIEAGVIEMNTSGSPAISDLNDNDLVWRLEAPASLFGEALGRVAIQKGWMTTVAMASNTPSALGDISGFVSYYVNNGGTVINTIVYNPDQTSYATEVEKALASNADVITITGYAPDVSKVLKDWWETGQTDQKWFGQTIAINEVTAANIGNEIVEGMTNVNSVPDLESPAYKSIAARYEEATGKSLGGNSYAAQAYDQVILVALAIEACKCDTGQEITKFIRDVSGPPGELVYSFAEGVKLLREGKNIDYEGASSMIDFDARGDPKPNFGIFELHDGKLVLVGNLSLSTK